MINERPDVDLVNMSLGTLVGYAGTCDTSGDGLADASAIGALRHRGVLTFAASGNDGMEGFIAEPGCLSSVVSVGATYDADVGSVDWNDCADATTGPSLVTCFSNSAPILDLLAPGAVIQAPALGGGTAEFDGTSAATPHAVGVAALLLQARPTLTPDQLEAVLKQTGAPVLDTRNNLTFPRADALAALDALAPLPNQPGPTFVPDADATFAEPGGDGGGGPDLGNVRVTAQRGIITFTLTIATGATLSGFQEVRVLVDADRNSSTGDSEGFDVRLDYSDEGASLERFENGSFAAIRPLGGVTVTANQVAIRISQEELGVAGNFAFRVTARDGTGADSDFAPAAARWSFPAFPVTVARTGSGSGTVTGGGLTCGDACSTFVARGESITLSASAGANSVFSGWGAPCSGTGACTVIVDAAKTVQARFEALRRLAVAKNGAGTGTVSSSPGGIDCGARCEAQYANGTAVTLQTRAATGSRFTRWRGACSGAGSCRVELDAARSVQATFADVARPTGRPLAARARRGTRATLRFRLRDNSSRARAIVTVTRGKRKLATVRRGLGPAAGSTYAVRWRVSRRIAPGAARFCLRPVDGSGNAGRTACTSLRVT